MDLHTGDEEHGVRAIDALLGGWEAALGAHAAACGDWASSSRSAALSHRRMCATLRTRARLCGSAVAPPAGAELAPIPAVSLSTKALAMGVSSSSLSIGGFSVHTGPSADAHPPLDGSAAVQRPQSVPSTLSYVPAGTPSVPLREPRSYAAEIAALHERSARDAEALAGHIASAFAPAVEQLRDDIAKRASGVRAALSAADASLRRPHATAAAACTSLVRVWRGRLESGADGDPEPWLTAPDVFVCEQALVGALAALLAERGRYASALCDALRTAAALDRHASATIAAAVEELAALIVRQERARIALVGGMCASSTAVHSDVAVVAPAAAERTWTDDELEGLARAISAPFPLDGVVSTAIARAAAEMHAGRVRPARVVRAGFVLRQAGTLSRAWSPAWLVLTDTGFAHLYDWPTVDAESRAVLVPGTHAVVVPRPTLNLHGRALADLNARASAALFGDAAVCADGGVPARSAEIAAVLARPALSFPVAHRDTQCVPEPSARGLEHVFAVAVPAGRGVFGRMSRRVSLRAFVADDMHAWIAAVRSLVGTVFVADECVFAAPPVCATSDASAVQPIILPDPTAHGVHSPSDQHPHRSLSPPDPMAHGSHSSPSLPEDDLANPWGGAL